MQPLRMIHWQSGRGEEILEVDRQPSHLVILCHGLQGNAGHMQYLMESIQASSSASDFLCLNIKCNDNNGWFKNYSKTSESLKIIGPRIREELFEFLKKEFSQNLHWRAENLSKISLIGSSLGGIYLRYLAGLLFDTKENIISFDLSFSRSSDMNDYDQEKLNFRLTPINYISLASPHLGVSGLVSDLIGSGMKLLFYNGIGSELLLDDDDRIFFLLATSEPYINALKSFRNRFSYSSCSENEWRVPYPSSAISPFYYKKERAKPMNTETKTFYFLKGDHHLKENEIDPFTPNLKENHDARYYFNESEEKQQLLETMIESLHSMSWCVTDVDLLHAQVAVLNSHRKEIVDHVLDIIKHKV